MLRTTAFRRGTLGKVLDTVFGASRTIEAAERAANDAQLKFARSEGTGETGPAVVSEVPEKDLSSTILAPRSILFVPCSNARALEKIANLPADFFILDLEDAVAPTQKLEARERLVDFVQSGKMQGKKFAVRINSVRTTPQWGFSDLDACGIIHQHLHAIAIPKVSMSDYDLIQPHLHPDVKLWAFFETAKSILDSRRICASGRYEMGIMGNNDLASDMHLPFRIPRSKQSKKQSQKPASPEDVAKQEAANQTASAAPPATEESLPDHRYGLNFAMSQVVLACRAYNMQVIDGVFNDPTDRVGLRQECWEGKNLGFDGKTLIHPDQISTANEMFDPSPEEEEWANTILDAAAKRDANQQGGVLAVDGQMVEEMHINRAKTITRRVVESAKMAQAEEEQLQASRKTGSEAESGGAKAVSNKRNRTLRRRGQTWNHVNQPENAYYPVEGADKWRL